MPSCHCLPDSTRSRAVLLPSFRAGRSVTFIRVTRHVTSPGYADFPVTLNPREAKTLLYGHRRREIKLRFRQNRAESRFLGCRRIDGSRPGGPLRGAMLPLFRLPLLNRARRREFAPASARLFANAGRGRRLLFIRCFCRLGRKGAALSFRTRNHRCGALTLSRPVDSIEKRPSSVRQDLGAFLKREISRMQMRLANVKRRKAFSA